VKASAHSYSKLAAGDCEQEDNATPAGRALWLKLIRHTNNA